jgi:SpoVK/Ycf46/Vps4 family AAA+-type ATPase
MISHPSTAASGTTRASTGGRERDSWRPGNDLARAPDSSQPALEAIVPYGSPWEHLHDQLQRLRLRVLLRLGAKGRLPRDGRLDGLQGLVISEQEIAALLDGMTPAPDADAAVQYTALSESLAAIDASIAAREAASQHGSTRLPLLVLRERCALSPMDEQCLVIAAAPDIDIRYEKVYAFLQDDVTRKRPTVGLMLDLLCGSAEEAIAARRCFDARAPLFRFHLCESAEAAHEGSSLARPVTLKEHVAEWLLGRTDLDAQLDGIGRLSLPDARQGPVLVDEALGARLSAFLDACGGAASTGSAVVHLRGARGAGKRALAESICRKRGLALLTVDLERLLDKATAWAEALSHVGREALLHRAALCVDGIDVLFADAEKRRSQLAAFFETLQIFSTLTFLLGVDAAPVREWTGSARFLAVQLPLPNADTRARLWEAYLDREPDVSADVSPAELASLFRLGPGAMNQALVAARDVALWRSPARPQITMSDITIACRSLASARLNTLAHHITPRQSWNELVLPVDQVAQLHELCDQARFRHAVQGRWGFERRLPLGRGITALFSGPPGTGKTMAAQVIAAELRLDLYQVDLSRVVSKYIGETEKNLRSVFDEADASQAILFFDEADALFGRRSEVKDAHDRHANIEVGYLLQRMEAYEGVAILATNFRQNVDEAFVRRLRFIVEFPFPDEEHRRRIWEVTFPPEAPLAGDVDFGVLARQLKLAGGNIKNIALAAAFSAAAGGDVIGMPHLVQAARREHQKLGKSWLEPQRLAGQQP